MNEPVVEIYEHPRGDLLTIEHGCGSITLTRAEAYRLFELLNANIGKMGVSLTAPDPATARDGGKAVAG